jgi:putative transposase
MPRQLRYFLPEIPQHVITRGVDRNPVFFQQNDYELYLKALRETAAANDCRVHAYVLMTNHVHLLVTPGHARSLPLMMQAMGRQYVQRLNVRYQRTGTLWEGRYKASLVQSDRYFLACQRYIELNPVRAGIAASPDEYRYSSYGHHALGIADPLLSSHSCYVSLHVDPVARRQAYRLLFQDALTDKMLSRIRWRTNACSVIGDHRFKVQIEAMLDRTVPTGKRGRPPKAAKKSVRPV